MVAIAAQFAGRRPGLGTAWLVSKDKIALADPAGRRLGVDEKAMSATFVITEEVADRVGDMVKVSGIYLENFKRNPIAFYNHQSTPSIALPIGIWEDPSGNLTIIKEARRAIGTLYFSQKNRDAYQIFQLVVESILRACSLGFNPLVEPVPLDRNEPNPNSVQRGSVFPEIDLLEVSVVGTPCVPTATLVRAHLASGKIGGEPISAMLRKSLAPLAESAPIWSPGGFASAASQIAQSTPATELRNPAPAFAPAAQKKGDIAMSHKWKKAAPKKKKEALAESNGTAGGYAAPEDKPETKAEEEATGHETFQAIRGVMAKHQKDAPADGPHDAYFHPEKAMVFHHHSKDADPEHLERVKADLDEADGTAGTEQGTELPAEKGYLKVFDGSRQNGEPSAPEMEQRSYTPSVTKKKRASGGAPKNEDEFWRRYSGAMDAGYSSDEAAAIAHGGSDKKSLANKAVRRKTQLAFHIGRGKSVIAMKRHLPRKLKDALEECVQRKIGIIAADHPEMEPTQREAVAYSTCGEAKGLVDQDDYEHKDDMVSGGEEEEGGGDNPMGPADEADPTPASDTTDEMQPRSLELCQSAIENLEEALPGLEPEDREFFEGIIEQIRDYGMGRHPEADFGGEEVESSGADVPDPEEEAETESVLAQYRSFAPTPKNRSSWQRRRVSKGLEDLASPEHHRMLKKSADLHHEVGDMPEGAPISKRVKRLSTEMGRDIDGLHGAITRGMKPASEPEPLPVPTLGAETKDEDAPPEKPFEKPGIEEKDAAIWEQTLAIAGPLSHEMAAINERFKNIERSNYRVFGK